MEKDSNKNSINKQEDKISPFSFSADLPDVYQDDVKEILLEKSYQYIKQFTYIGHSISSSFDLDEIIQKSYNHISEMIPVSSMGIGIYNEESENINYHHYQKKKKHSHINIPISDQSHLIVDSTLNKLELLIGDAQSQRQSITHSIEETLSFEKYGEDLLLGSIICIPLLSREKPIGAILIQHEEKHKYTGYHLYILKNLATHIALAIDNASAYQKIKLQSDKILTQNEELEQKSVELLKKKDLIDAQHNELEKAHNDVKLVTEIGKHITTSLTVNKIVNAIYRNINTLMDAPTFVIGIFNEKENCLEFSGVEGIYEEQKRIQGKESIDTGRTLSVWSFNHQKVIFINDYDKESHKFKGHDLITNSLKKSFIYVPIIYKKNKIGVITVQSERLNAYERRHLTMLQAFASYVSIAIDNANAYQKIQEQARDLLIAQKVIKEKNATLENTNFILEEKVQHRTAELEKAYRKIVNANQEFDTFIYRASHDLKGPIASLLGLAQIGVNDFEDHQALSYFRMLRQTASNMNRTLEKLLGVNVINHDTSEISKIEFQEIVSEIIESQQSYLDKNEIQLHYEIEKDIDFHSDEKLIKIIFRNLLENAIFYHARSNHRKPRIEIQISKLKDEIKLAVRDNGIGIMEEQLNKVFNMFYRGTELSTGNGLGLYVTKKAVEKLKGRVSVESEYNKFAFFTITLPA